jgi:hypothetical protein
MKNWSCRHDGGHTARGGTSDRYGLDVRSPDCKHRELVQIARARIVCPYRQSIAGDVTGFDGEGDRGHTAGVLLASGCPKGVTVPQKIPEQPNMSVGIDRTLQTARGRLLATLVVTVAIAFGCTAPDETAGIGTDGDGGSESASGLVLESVMLELAFDESVRVEGASNDTRPTRSARVTLQQQAHENRFGETLRATDSAGNVAGLRVEVDASGADGGM